jgi:aldehyde dehydrogenase (NAD+)
MYVGGEWVAPASNQWFESFNPFTGEPWALVARGNAQDADQAVRTAHAAFTDGPWPQMNASQRGALLHKLGDLIAKNAERLAQLEVMDNGKLIAEMRAQLNYAPQWYYYFGGLADKVQGAVIPLDKKGYFNFTRYEPAWRGGGDHPLELAVAADGVEASSGAGRRQHDRHQTF